MVKAKSLCIFVLVIGQLQCAQVGMQNHMQEAPFDTKLRPASVSFSLVQAQNNLNLAFAERSSAAIVLAEIAVSRSSEAPFALNAVTYLDRVSDQPATDALFGAHLFFTEGRDRHLFYVDRKSDEQIILKHVRWAAEGGNALIDVLPFSGRPIWASRNEEGTMEVFYEKDRSLRRQPVNSFSSSEILLSPFDSAGNVSFLDSRTVQGFSAFDHVSQRLIVFLRRGSSIGQHPVARFGMVHSSAAADDGSIRIAAFDQQHNRIMLFQKSRPDSDFEERPLAPGREVGCLGVFLYRGMPFYLYSERAEPDTRKDPYRFSLLAPQYGLRTLRYRRHILGSAAKPFLSFHSIVAEDLLYVAYLQDSLRLLRVDLRNYLRSESD